MADGRFFSTTKKGEVAEYKNDLHSLDRKSQKNAVKRVIAAMTVGKDVSSLFPGTHNVVNCMQTEDMELKKLVYLYLINYAKTQPDLAIMAVNTFVKDTQDPNPLIRALAVRTMGCIRVDKITEYLCDPLQRCLKDEDPYVRKTAAVCVAKLYDISAEMVEDRGFLDVLRDMVGDANPMVVANAVAALAEIQASSSGPVFVIDGAVLTKLLRALNECSEWGQVFILDALAAYTPADSRDAEGIVERVAARLQHANGAVVLSAIKLILHAAKYIEDAGARAAIHKKLAPPLVTLLGAEPEIQYVALRNIDLIVQSVPGILSHEVKVFFCKYNDPIYVKTEKLEIMIKLADEKNIDQVLLELREYASEVDVDFVRKAVRAVGRCAISLEPAAERCVNVLLDLIQGRVSYVVQEAVVVLRDVFRRYPGRYERVIAPLCECLEALDEPEAKAAMVWIIGEYADRIDNADELLEQFLEGFPEESPGVQLALVTATVKLFLRKPSEKPQALIQLVLSYATQETDSPDLRDRAYIYWRLLSADPDAARDVVLAPRPVIEAAADGVDPALRAELLGELGSLASVLHRPAAAFTSAARLAVRRASQLGAGGVGAGKGLVIRGGVEREAGGQLAYQLHLENAGAGVPLDGFMIQLNKNGWGLVPQSQTIPVPRLAPGASASARVPLVQNPASATPALTPALQVAIKVSQLGVLYLADAVPLAALLREDGRTSPEAFVGEWQALPDAAEQARTLPLVIHAVPAAQASLEAARLFVMAHKSVPGAEVLYVTGAAGLPSGQRAQLLLELRFVPGQRGVATVFKAQETSLAPAAFDAVAAALS
ncbi:Beta-adaptin-like protein C [Auxenochlorella protothecoides]|uniref:Beta-adaptin-like protein C n=1 Tax=Auxenochlorella protothecoides TaxID=3075 RepID=A0A087SG98_AUXPR|nr:Beta-adaptin-like protein C [Auxenochlorella protothecoides]KFM24752.1 Beta-adaptin-like protein C [Auxenochlorella protothecoides]